MRFFYETSWMIEQPYAQGSGSVLGENPTFLTVEFYFTAFDDMSYLDPEDVVISSFEPGQVIGFDLAVIDWDHDDTRNGQFYLHDPSQESEAVGADGFVDAILLGPRRDGRRGHHMGPPESNQRGFQNMKNAKTRGDDDCLRTEKHVVFLRLATGLFATCSPPYPS